MWLPDKNLPELYEGKSLMAYTIRQALDRGLFERVEDFGDSERITKTAKNFGAKKSHCDTPK